MCRSTRHGTTLDNVTIRHAADDVLLGEVRLRAVDGFIVTIDRDATGFVEAQVEWPEHECAGWTVQQCRWEDNFQRLLIMSGPGVVRDCTFVRMGNGISLNTGMGLVGGVPSDVTITGSTFIDVHPRPRGAAVAARGHNALGQDGVPPIERLVITENTFIRSGGPALELVGIRHGRVERNRFESIGPEAGTARTADEAAPAAIVLRQSSHVVLAGNTLDGERLPDDTAAGGATTPD